MATIRAFVHAPKTLVAAPRPPRPPKISAVKLSNPPCEKCTYFQKGTCMLFFSQNPVDGGLVFFSADEARKDDDYCGTEGKFFKPRSGWGGHEIEDDMFMI